MYHAKYIKYKNKYLNLKYQLGGTFKEVIIKSSNIQNTTIPSESNDTLSKGIITSLKNNLVGLKVLESNSKVLISLVKYNLKFENNKIYYYRYTDKSENYILCSLYSYYEFLDILYEHIEIEEININEAGVITSLVPNRIYHIIPQPTSVPEQRITTPITNSIIPNLNILVDSLKKNSFIIIRKDGWDLRFLTAICMYNLFIGTIYVFDIVIDEKKTNFFLLSLFTEYELDQKCIYKPQNIKIYECRLYKQGDKIDFKLNMDMIAMMFSIYAEKRKIPNFYNEARFYRGNPAVDYKFLDKLDPELLHKCKDCISVKNVAYNTTLYLLPNEIEQAIRHKDIEEMINDFVANKHYLKNSNDKLMSWRQRYEDLIQLWEFSLKDLEKEVEKFKKELLDLEPEHQELLVQKLNEKGYDGCTMKQILENSVLCYLNDGDKKKKLVYENSVQIDPIDNEFIRNCKFIPEMKKLLERRYSGEDIESELHKYRQTILLMMKNKEIEKKYINNKSYFFAMSWYHHTYNDSFHKAFYPISWSIKLNKLAFQCLALKDNIIFPFRIINIEYLFNSLIYDFDIKKQKFIGYFNTRFTDNYNGVNNFNIECRDKFYFIYHYTDHDGNFSGKDYRPYYYTGNNIWFDVSILPYYKIILCEINWIYYTFILKYRKIPHFYKYINKFCEIEIVVSRYSLDEIRCIYLAKGYDTLELDELIEVFYNHNYYKREEINDTIFVDNPLLKTIEEQNVFINTIFSKNNL